jgi:hypothetical protein
MLKIHEFSVSNGELSQVGLRVLDGALEIVADGRSWPLPSGALGAVLTRFGAPFDVDARISEVARLELGTNETLRHVRHLAGYDVVARDYLVYERSANEAWCALAATVSAALLHLGRASSGESSAPPSV